jgi:hypothetical protein
MLMRLSAMTPRPTQRCARAASARQDGDQIDGLRNESTRNRNDRLLNELFEPSQRAEGRARVNGADPTGMSGAPGFQQVERFGTAHLADRYAIRPKPQ